jgi:hemerythrin-like metal-binding protein
MSLFKWYKRYSVNNNDLDKHHKTLFDIVNRLYDTWSGHDKANCLDSLIEELVSYSNYHFTAEEQHMRNIGYKHIDKHIIEHRNFKQRTIQLQQVAHKNKPNVTEELIEFLVHWLLHHVIVEDKKYSVHLNRRHQHGNLTRISI